MRKLTMLAAVAAFGVAAQVTPRTSEMEVCDGRLEHFDLYSPQLQRDVPVDVWLPSGYDPKRAEAYPVIYMHDGQNVFDATRTWNRQAWEVDSVASLLISKGEIPTPVVVGVYSQAETRVGDLMPNGIMNLINPALTADGVSKMCAGGIKGDLYIDFLADTLKPVVDSLYNVRRDVDGTSVMGSSMGGLISLNALCHRPEVFGRAACLSTHISGFGSNSVFPTALNAFLIGHLPLDGKHRIYVDTGDHDVDSQYTEFYPAFVRTFTDVGYIEGENFEHGFYPGGCHREDNWMLRVEHPLRFLLKN